MISLNGSEIKDWRWIHARKFTIYTTSLGEKKFDIIYLVCRVIYKSYHEAHIDI